MEQALPKVKIVSSVRNVSVALQCCCEARLIPGRYVGCWFGYCGVPGNWSCGCDTTLCDPVPVERRARADCVRRAAAEDDLTDFGFTDPRSDGPPELRSRLKVTA